MPINAGYEYFNAEKIYLEAKTVEDKIIALEGMIKTAPKHKGSESLLAELKTRLKKLREKQERVKKSGGGAKGIKKEGYQVVLLGLTNSGKSSLLSVLTNAKPGISSTMFTTRRPELGTMDYEGVRAQVVDMPGVGSSAFDLGLINNADCIIEVVDKLEDLVQLEPSLVRATGKRIIVVMKIDLLSSEERRKLTERCKSKRIHALFVSGITGEGVPELKKRIFEYMGVLRVYMKEPGKPATSIPGVLPIGSTVKDVAESIFHGFARKVSETRITGPSAKFAHQKVGLSHVVKDRDIIEFHTR